jgi:adenine C2-methylase RlmN of 23S rRNA A2503 and tRNA A37
VLSANARKATWDQIHRVGPFFGIGLHSKKAEILQKIMEDNQNRSDPSPSASNEAFLEDNQRVTYTYTVNADVIELLRM